MYSVNWHHESYHLYVENNKKICLEEYRQAQEGQDFSKKGDQKADERQKQPLKFIEE